MATDARVREVNGERIAEHKHDGYGWHWASAGHRDDGKIHKDAGADKPKFVEGTSKEDEELYRKSFTREIVNKIPSKAKPKTEPEEKAEAPTPMRQPAGTGSR